MKARISPADIGTLWSHVNPCVEFLCAFLHLPKTLFHFSLHLQPNGRILIIFGQGHVYNVADLIHFLFISHRFTTLACFPMETRIPQVGTMGREVNLIHLWTVSFYCFPCVCFSLLYLFLILMTLFPVACVWLDPRPNWIWPKNTGPSSSLDPDESGLNLGSKISLTQVLMEMYSWFRWISKKKYS